MAAVGKAEPLRPSQGRSRRRRRTRPQVWRAGPRLLGAAKSTLIRDRCPLLTLWGRHISVVRCQPYGISAAGVGHQDTANIGCKPDCPPASPSQVHVLLDHVGAVASWPRGRRWSPSSSPPASRADAKVRLPKSQATGQVPVDVGPPLPSRSSPWASAPAAPLARMPSRDWPLPLSLVDVYTPFS
ncbi:hypothetical protein J1605_021616 [Eschrichtius robustus]|uniref:Uncharacterized protein n=1 Tax=Eschrichtius robustus TaxID=9764 RepID=A0AB34HCH9_ESCRO|nr:hypothetical protein J1605_021616 [Eschrichtius robustus]